jgi:hypothetical protein
VRIVLLNFAVPEAEGSSGSFRWWHKSGSRWPATIRDRRTDGTEYFPWPFLLSYLASMLRREAHDVVMLDGCLERFHLSDALDAVRSARPDFIVFETSEQTESSDRGVVSRLGDIAPVVLIGPNVATDRADLLSWPGVRAAVPGEYLLSVVQYFREPRCGWADRREVLGQEEMDSLPFAYRDASAFPRYNARFKSTPPGVQGQFVSMWGCQYRCSFCIWIHAYWATSTQFKKQFSLPRLKAEIDEMRRRFPGITSLYDDADNHAYQGDLSLEFAEMMGRTGLPWAVLTRADTYMTKSGSIDREKWRFYRNNGCYALKIGVEGVQQVMDASHKHLSEEVVREFVPTMQDLGMTVYCSFMIGAPGFPPSADQATLRLINDLGSHRPDLFEYLISRCDVTRVTPFSREVSREAGSRARPHDGQRRIEEVERAGALTRSLAVKPNNL